ncbi:endonuclease/exonuclease/phosphatase family protein [Streptomyces sp. WAC 06725]|uniref:endonuclease/exonuclease/phosphatase family protein n=1 Tax=Streptomyces sp. WAC 06725 TaxID=2203209 RepID=UPI00163B6905|nr:endonuclease/exonuclease/phosphatase family protein [Streptomyces sp. WAC 06725]
MARYVTWNLDNGGIDPGGAEGRRRNQIDALTSLDPKPDILALQEITGWQRQDWYRLYALANALKMVPLHPVTSNAGNGENHMALLYRPSEVTILSYDKVHDGGRFHHGLGRAHVIIDGTEVMILFTHLCPFDPAVRLQEAKFITDYAGSFPGRPDNAVLLGDLNTADRGPTAETPIGQSSEPDWDHDVPPNLQARYRLINADERRDGVFGDTDRRALNVLYAAGWTDPQDLLPDYPRQATVGHRYDTEPTPLRLDHVLYAGRQINPAHYTTISNEKTRSASDHLPVCLDTD